MQVTNCSIRTIIEKIRNNEIILPALQREFVWRRRDIENLFDSLMQDYPINTMMFWLVNDIKTENLEFYKFLNPDYQEGKTINEPYKTKEKEKKTIVIDGQQRLTSLYIGIYGSYKTEKLQNETYLYLNLDSSIGANKDEEEGNINTDKKYNFRFLKQDIADIFINRGEHWIKVGDVYDADFSHTKYLIKNNLAENDWATKTLEKLHGLFDRDKNIINYYPIERDNLQDVLDIFVRSNNGGHKLTKGDLLLSMITVNWASSNNENARDYIQDILKDCIYKRVDKDWVLSCILYILEKGCKLSVEQFDKATSIKIYDNRENIKEAIDATFTLVRKFGMHENGLSTKLALLPITYHIYNNRNLAAEIKKGYKNGQECIFDDGTYNDMRTWLFVAIATNLFRAGTNETLEKILELQINNNKDKKKKDQFPYKEIVNELKISISKDDIEDMMHTEKKVAFPLLNIIYSDNSYFVDNLEKNKDFDIDHIHPKSHFDKDKDDNRYDTIPNLQLLVGEQNKSKNDLGFKKWWTNMHDDKKKDYLFPEDFNPSPDAFDEFFEKRKAMLMQILADKLGGCIDETHVMNPKTITNMIPNSVLNNHSEEFSFLTIDMLNNPNKRPPYTKREILQKEYPDFWGGANELVRILRELQNLIVNILPQHKQVLPKTFEKLEDHNYQNICLNYIKYRILYAFAEAVWKKTEQHCTDIATKPNDNDSAKTALIHSFEVFDAYPLEDIVGTDKTGYETMNEMIEKFEPHFVFKVLSIGSWEYHDITAVIQSYGLKSKQFEQLWKDALVDPDPTKASVGELLDNNEPERFY